MMQAQYIGERHPCLIVEPLEIQTHKIVLVISAAHLTERLITVDQAAWHRHPVRAVMKREMNAVEIAFCRLDHSDNGNSIGHMPELHKHIKNGCELNRIADHRASPITYGCGDTVTDLPGKTNRVWVLRND
jgi:hypothetical protein